MRTVLRVPTLLTLLVVSSMGQLVEAEDKAAEVVDKPSARSTAQPTELLLDLGGGVKMELVLLPAGEFQMGSNKKNRPSEGPQHRVRIGQPFYMGKYEVTQAQWKAVMGNNPSYFKGSVDLPVENVSWDDAVAFCEKLSRKTGREIRLPSAAEWEYGCRAGTRTAYSFGDSADELEGYAWFNDNWDGKTNSDGKTHAVGSKRANGWGMYNMHGNVAEWCQDVWHEDYSGAPTDGSAWTRGGEQELRVLRGGTFDFRNRVYLRSANRGRSTHDVHSYFMGFRVVVGVSPGTP